MSNLKPKVNELPTGCLLCGKAYEITRLHCENCEITVEGRFVPGHFANLSKVQWEFVETFIRCKGKIKDVEVALDISYPTVIGRLNDLVRALGFEVEEDAGASEEKRKDILQKLARKELSAKDALRLLNVESD